MWNVKTSYSILSQHDSSQLHEHGKPGRLDDFPANSRKHQSKGNAGIVDLDHLGCRCQTSFPTMRLTGSLQTHGLGP